MGRTFVEYLDHTFQSDSVETDQKVTKKLDIEEDKLASVQEAFD